MSCDCVVVLGWVKGDDVVVELSQSKFSAGQLVVEVVETKSRT